ncbi:MAG TPA: sulfotransferase family protein [Gammaproteobacteria bacterium]|nr:sulfotransferase family protein [Gammaproteobacteria bacterium]
MKIFGIGVNKTGTKSLGEALSRLGFNHRAWSRETYEIYREHGVPGLLGVVEKYDSFEDWPWPLVYREIDEAVPGSKFILTLRESPELWYRSLCKHSMRTGPNVMRSEIYGYPIPQMNKDEHIRFYNEHVENVRNYFKGRPDDLLEVCWGRGDGWSELAAFLGCECPDEPFPHRNKSES